MKIISIALESFEESMTNTIIEHTLHIEMSLNVAIIGA
jgi:hypothetical protein